MTTKLLTLPPPCPVSLSETQPHEDRNASWRCVPNIGEGDPFARKEPGVTCTSRGQETSGLARNSPKRRESRQGSRASRVLEPISFSLEAIRNSFPASFAVTSGHTAAFETIECKGLAGALGLTHRHPLLTLLHASPPCTVWVQKSMVTLGAVHGGGGAMRRKGPGSLNHGLEGSQSGTPTLDGVGGRKKSPSCLRHCTSLGLLVTAAKDALADTVSAHCALKAERARASQSPPGCVIWTSYENLSGPNVL